MILISALIIIFIVMTAIFSKQLNIPVILIALLVGIVFGSDVSGFVYFDNSEFVRKFSDVVLIFVLFAGGFNSQYHKLKAIIKPAIVLATIGVLVTAVLSAFIFSKFTSYSFGISLLIASIISSTDAAAVFSILKNKTIVNKVGSLTEVESAANDPMAIVLTTFVLSYITGTGIGKTSDILLNFLWQFVGGILIGWIVGLIAYHMLKYVLNLYKEYIFLFLIGVILLTYGLAVQVNASGALAAFFCGIILGNKKFPLKKGISSFVETISFITNVILFILLGLLVFPKEFSNIWDKSLLLFFIITFIGRPISIFLCSLKWKLNFKENVFLSWSGIRGAVPIILAIYPLAAGLPEGKEIFNMIFLAVVISIVVQGMSIGKLADYFKLSKASKNKPFQALELMTVVSTDYDLVELYIDEDIYEGFVKISELNLPTETTITMVTRNGKIIAPLGDTVLQHGDVISILTKASKIEESSDAILINFNSLDDEHKV